MKCHPATKSLATNADKPQLIYSEGHAEAGKIQDFLATCYNLDFQIWKLFQPRLSQCN